MKKPTLFDCNTQKSDLARKTQQEQKRKLKAEWRKTEKSLVQQGKTPFYLKKRDAETLSLVDRYVELKQSGKLKSFMEKRRKRNANKDKRKMPKNMQ